MGGRLWPEGWFREKGSRREVKEKGGNEGGEDELGIFGRGEGTIICVKRPAREERESGVS